MPYCVNVKLPDGSTAMSGKRKTCFLCGKPCAKLCDFVISPPEQITHKKTCDRPMCESCAINGGAELDYCPEHANAVGVKRYAK
jgi:hypothetical protein